MDRPAVVADGMSAPLATTGLAAVAKTIRDVDEEKIRNCKEDIDTLLVFAGLFSAVLTTILVDSYQALRQDPSDAMLRVLERIAAQTSSYTFTNGFLNSSSLAPPPPPSIAPPSTTIHVNALWFASLVLSLVTASLGILVKQWLREYMAGEYVSPQARLRVRHFRYPGLRNWKVFEIAAVLPLLLQLSLGLFFIGLCMFTWDLHPAVGYTTTPLVTGWGFLVFAATLAPAFSPRCPYKTVFLMSSLRYIRRHVVRRAHSLSSVVFLALRRASSSSRAVTSSWVVDFSGLPQSTKFIRARDVHFQEEDEVVKDDTHDVNILLALDATLMDDHYLTFAMWTSLERSQTPLAVMVLFMKRIVARRIGCDEDKLLTCGQLNMLSRTQWSTMVHCLLEILERNLASWDTASKSLPPPLVEALILLLLPSSYSFPVDAAYKLETWFSNMSLCNAIAFSLAGKRPVTPAAGRLLHTLPRFIFLFQGGLSRFRALDHVVRWSLQSEDQSITLPDRQFYLVSCKAQLTSGSLSNRDDLYYALNLLVSILVRSLDEECDVDHAPSTVAMTSSWLTQALFAVFNLLDVLQFPQKFASNLQFYELRGLFVDLLRNPFGMRLLIHAFLHLETAESTGLLDQRLRHIFVYVRKIRVVQAQPTLPMNFLSFLEEPASGSSALTLSQVQRLCYMALHIVAPTGLRNSSTRIEWQRLFSRLQEILCSTAHTTQPADIQNFAEHCLKRIYLLDTSPEGDLSGDDVMDADRTDYDLWLTSPRRKQSVFGDDLVMFFCRMNSRAVPGESANSRREFGDSSEGSLAPCRCASLMSI